MSTVGAFNQTLKSFLQELVDVFQDEPGVGKVQFFLSGLDLFISVNPRAALDGFLEAVAPHADLITAKDPKLFKKLELPGGITLGDLWKKASPQTQEAVWQYLQMLFLLASTAAAVPQDMLNAIEGMASQYAEKVKSGELDLTSVASLLGGGGSGGLGALGGLLGGSAGGSGGGFDLSSVASLLGGMGGGMGGGGGSSGGLENLAAGFLPGLGGMLESPPKKKSSKKHPK